MNKKLKQYLYMLVGKELTRKDYEYILQEFDKIVLRNKNLRREIIFDDNVIVVARERINKYINIINKAIEFLKENACYDYGDFSRDLIYYDCRQLLDILKGSDKE